jgi:abortive infection bacteriophage resistance protein
MKNSTHKYKNNHQRSKSEISQPINNHLSVVSPTRSLNEINKFSLSDNNSRKRPANNIDQIINFNDIKNYIINFKILNEDLII